MTKYHIYEIRYDLYTLFTDWTDGNITVGQFKDAVGQIPEELTVEVPDNPTALFASLAEAVQDATGWPVFGFKYEQAGE